VRELVGLAKHEKEFARRGVRVFAISREEVGELEELQGMLGTAVTLLSDTDGSAARAFGMSDVRRFRMKEEQMRAGTFSIDRDGQVTRRWLEGNYRDRPDPEEILAALGP